ncbi:MAG: histidinol-phosphate transaminase [Akkermansia sp.]|nr:histidinol-phosphate transaminase [Akkermansia sp.]
MSIISYANQNVYELVAYQPGKPIEETARELGLRPEDIVKLASNENSMGPSPMAVQAMQQAAAGVHIYPDGASFSLRSRVAAEHGVGFENTVVANGSSELIELLGHAFLRPGTEVIAADYAFTLYPIVAKLLGADYISIPNRDKWTHNLEAMLAAITPRTRLVFITNPTNPVGTMVTQAELESFIERVPEHVVVAIDEAYIEFAGEPTDSVKFVKAGKQVAVLRTFSKAYGLAGARCGYAITSPEIADLLNKARSPFNVNSLAQVGALAALDDKKHIARSVNMVNQGRQAYVQFFEEKGLEYVPSHTNFILVNVGNGVEVFRKALSRGVIMRPMAAYGLTEYIRITIGNAQENARCIEVLSELL